MGELVNLTVQDGVARLELDDAATLNAIGCAMASQLEAAFKALADRADVRAVLLSGRGAHFSSGGNLRDAIVASGDTPYGARDFMATFNRLIRRVYTFPKPVISVVRGSAAGGALGLVLATDIILLARSAKLMQAFIHVGLAPDCGTSTLLARRIGPGRAKAMSLTGCQVPAEEALAMGLGDALYDDDQIEKEAARLAAAIAAKAPLASASTKQLLQAASSMTLESALAMEAAVQESLLHSDDFAEGAAAFIEKRRPVFTGR